MANQPQSTSSNHNFSKASKDRAPPKRNKKAKYSKPPKVARKAKLDNQQSKLINKLSKQVYSLQMSKYGSVQQNYHTLSEIIIPTGVQPLCLDLTDFTCHRPDNPNSQNGALVYQHVPGLVVPSTPSKWTIQPYEQNYYWNKQNKDQPDGGAYLAMSATYFVEIVGVNALDNTRVRFDVISQKPDAIVSNPGVSDNTLPNTLVHMKHLANPMGSASNRINPLYFRKYFSKTVFINSTKTDSNTKGTTANIIRFSFKIKPNKLCTQQDTNPTIGNLDPQPEIPRGNFGPYNVNATQPLWMLISTDDRTSIGDAVSVNMSRRIVWRDAGAGSASI